MNNSAISKVEILKFKNFLESEDKSANTISKYMRDIKKFSEFANESTITKLLVTEYKKSLVSRNYAPRSVNSMLASLNGFLKFTKRSNCIVKPVKLQKEIYCSTDKLLTKSEYKRLCHAAEENRNHRLCLILQTICGTGIRISELQFITVEAVKEGKATVSLKGKTRTIFIIKNLKKKLLRYAAEQGIRSGLIFRTRTGKAMSRSNIWKEMKSLCSKARVNRDKVFPHNFRHLFARVFYELEKDIGKLADLLGHSNINTTRIYLISTGAEHIRNMEKMRLVI